MNIAIRMSYQFIRTLSGTRLRECHKCLFQRKVGWYYHHKQSYYLHIESVKHYCGQMPRLRLRKYRFEEIYSDDSIWNDEHPLVQQGVRHMLEMQLKKVPQVG